MAFTISGLLSTFLLILLSGWFLWLAERFFRLKDRGYLFALKIAASVGAVNYLFSLLGRTQVLYLFNIVVTVVLSYGLIWKYYGLNYRRTFPVWILWVLLSLVASFIVTIGLVALGIAPV